MYKYARQVHVFKPHLRDLESVLAGSRVVSTQFSIRSIVIGTSLDTNALSAYQAHGSLCKSSTRKLAFVVQTTDGAIVRMTDSSKSTAFASSLEEMLSSSGIWSRTLNLVRSASAAFI